MNAEWALRTVADELHGRFDAPRRRLLPRARHRPRRRARPRAAEPGRGGRRALARRGCPAASCWWRAASPPSEAAELDWERVLAVATDEGSRHVPHVDPRALLRRARRGRPARRHPPHRARRDRGGGRHARPGGGRALGARARGLPRRPGARARRGRAPAGDARACRRSRATGGRSCCARTSSSRTTRRRPALHGAEGIGLFRSEYLLGRARRLAVRGAAARGLLAAARSRWRPIPVTVRTWDVGLEDLALGGPSCANPALGERALRLLPRRPRRRSVASCARCCAPPPHGPLRVMFPFVTGPSRPAPRARAADRGGAATRWPRRASSTRRDIDLGLNLEVPVRGPDRGPAGPRRRLLLHRHQRPRPVPAGRGPGRPARRRPSTSRCTPRYCACSARWWRRPTARRAGVGVRRDGGGRPAGAAARGPGRARAVHEPRGHPAGQGRHPRRARGRAVPPRAHLPRPAHGRRDRG